MLEEGKIKLKLNNSGASRQDQSSIFRIYNSLIDGSKVYKKTKKIFKNSKLKLKA